MIRRVLTTYEHFFWRVTMLLIVGDLLIGLGFLLGAPTNSTSYDAARAIMSLHYWGVVAIVAAAIYIAGIVRHNRWLLLTGLSIGGFYTTLFAITFIFAYFGGFLAGFTGIIWWLVIGIMHTMAAIALPSTKQIQRLKYGTPEISC